MKESDVQSVLLLDRSISLQQGPCDSDSLKHLPCAPAHLCVCVCVRACVCVCVCQLSVAVGVLSKCKQKSRCTADRHTHYMKPETPRCGGTTHTHIHTHTNQKYIPFHSVEIQHDLISITENVLLIPEGNIRFGTSSYRSNTIHRHTAHMLGKKYKPYCRHYLISLWHGSKGKLLLFVCVAFL